MARHRFTDKWLKHLPPANADRLEFVDAICPGLYLRVGRTGTKTFSALIRVAGRLQRQTIGRYPRWTIADARQQAMKLMRDADIGIDPRAEAQALKEAITFEDLVKAFVEQHLKPNARSCRNIQSNLSNPRLRHFFKRPAASITKKDIVAVLDKIVATGKPHGATNVLRNLRMMYNWAADRDMVSSNPCDRIRPPVRTTERDRVLADEEIVAVWNATYQLPWPYGMMYRSFMLTGQRRSEVATMRWSHIKDNVWTIPREVVKKDRPHAVPLSTAMVKNLGKSCFFGPDAYVFTTTGGEAPSSNFHKTKKELDRLSGVTGWCIHDIRRTVRSKLAELGVPREVARKVLNHEDGKVDRIYNRHEYLAEKREALEKWGKHLMQLVARPH